jgi:predicted O-methyltransferase YrrM
MGESTIWFSKHVNEVYSVEINDKYYNISLDKFTKNNITNINVFKDDTIKFLQNNIKNIKSKYDKILCYLDAHWEEVSPLCNEILEIAKVYAFILNLEGINK